MDCTKLDAWLEDHIPELLEELGSLVAINSERREAREGMPYGEGNAACAAAAEALLKKTGMRVKNYDNYVLTADLNPEAPAGLDILAHLDVVPAGDGWTVTDPFTMKVVGDRVYGRGTADDKGPALCALYAMRAVQALGIPLSRNVRLILGFDEECGSSDLQYYFRQEKSAPCSLSPDADFPLINIEKGGTHADFAVSLPIARELPRITSFHGGLKTNVIPGRAEALVEGLDSRTVLDTAAAMEGLRDITFTCEAAGDALHIIALGSTGHASMPATAHNAITGLIALLAALPLSEGALHDRFRALSRLFPHGDFYGHGLGVDLEDAVSGKTVISLTVCAYEAGQDLTGKTDCRACLSATDENTADVIRRRFEEAGLTPAGVPRMFPPHHVPEDSPLVQTLLDIYQDMTGLRPAPLCIGGGTYVHHIDNGVAFGCGFEGLDNHMHANDEFMTLEQIRFSCRIYARAIAALCGE